jgi:hypothetical protein
MTTRMRFQRADTHAYISREGDRFGIYIDGGDLAHLELTLRRHRAEDRDAILFDYYTHVAAIMSGERDALLAAVETSH